MAIYHQNMPNWYYYLTQTYGRLQMDAIEAACPLSGGEGAGWLTLGVKSRPRLIKYAAGRTYRRNPRGWNCWRLIKSFYFFVFGSLLAIIIVTRTHTFTSLLQDPRCSCEPTTAKKRRKKPKTINSDKGA